MCFTHEAMSSASPTAELRLEDSAGEVLGDAHDGGWLGLYSPSPSEHSEGAGVRRFTSGSLAAVEETSRGWVGPVSSVKSRPDSSLVKSGNASFEL